MKTNLFILLISLALAIGLGASGAIAQQAEPAAPQAALGSAFTYQGYLTAGESPADGQYDFRFRLFDSLEEGAQVGGDLTLVDVVVNDGLFTVQLDFGAAAFDGTARWLEVAVRSAGSNDDYTPLSPRQALTAAPYALFAQSAPWSGLTGVPAGLDDGDDDTTAFWGLSGSNGTNPASNYLGTSDNQPLELRVNGARALRLEPTDGTPNLIGGYSGNIVTAGVDGAVIGGGGKDSYENIVTDHFGTVGGGAGNQAGDNDGALYDADYATVGGGWENTASEDYATVGGGRENTASEINATVGGGSSNTANGFRATVGGGFSNTASGYGATVPGGADNVAAGYYSFAAGRRAVASPAAEGTFVWSDSNDFDTTAGAPNAFLVRATGGFWFGTAIDPSNGVWTAGAKLPSGSGQWSSLSDRNMKTAFQAIDTREIAAKVAKLPLQTWSYKAQSEDIRHMGPMAQDFYAVFGLGEDERYIGTLDASGVSLAAIQGLYQLNQEQLTHIKELEDRLDEQGDKIEQLEARLIALERADPPALARVSPTLAYLPIFGLALLGACGTWWVKQRGGVR